MRLSSSTTVPKFEIYRNEIQLERQVTPQTYCESVGQKSAMLGNESGLFEIWVYPFKILSDLNFTVFIPQYNLSIKCTTIAKRIIVRPELLTISYSHDLFTIHQHLLTPMDQPGAIVLFDIDTCTPLELWISFIPNLIPMWPAGLGGQYTLWLDDLKSYYLGEGSKKYVGLIGSPFAKKISETPGHQLPNDPMKFAISISTDLAAETYIPIIIAGSTTGKDTAMHTFDQLSNSIPAYYQEKYEYYQRLQKETLRIKTPLPELDQAYEWAKISLDKGLADNPHLGKGMVAGYGISGKTQRPGFAWFFGGDTCLNSLAVDCYGDFELVRKSLELLAKNQRDDGKIFHELTQSADLLNWFQDYPYGFYHAETSAFFIVAMADYLMRSGDKDFIIENWEGIKQAYHYCIRSDEDGDGLMENSAAGLAAMEVGEMLQRNLVDIYLASIWLQALRSIIQLSEIMGEPEFQKQCEKYYQKANHSFEQIFIDQEKQEICFALLTDGSKHLDTTVWQSIPYFFNLIENQNAHNTIVQLASADLATDWGVRGVARSSKFYDPISYNNGSVWPFTTGYVAAAEYRYHRAINGWQNLLANARLTSLDALGWQTELLSGEFYRPVSTSVPHQLFSATGIINPLVLGLLGLESNAISHEIKFCPHLPFDWDEIRVQNYAVGQDKFNFFIHRTNDRFALEIHSHAQNKYNIKFSPSFGLGAQIEHVLIDQADANFAVVETQYDVHCNIQCQIQNKSNIEIQYSEGIELELPLPQLQIGSRSKGLRLLDYELGGNQLRILCEGLSGLKYHLQIRSGFRLEKCDGGKLKQIDDLLWELEIAFKKAAKNHYIRKEIKIQLARPTIMQS
ncbi:MAG: GH116 family glycosyl hydrolase [bacterium]|nr:GH116 family glycosyl hydrolase [bacterium]